MCNSDDVSFFNQNKSLINVVRVLLFSLESDKHNSMFYDNDYEKVLSFIDSLENQNIGKVVVVPITDDNYSELTLLSSWIYSKGFKINPIPIPKCCGDKVKVLGKDNFETFLQDLQILQHDLGEELYLDTPIGYEKFYKPCVCPAFRLSFDLHNGFGIRPCKFSKTFMGKIENINLNWATCKNLWQKSEQCLRCSDFEKCGGGCICNKNTIDEKDFYCNKKEEDFVNV